MHILPEPARTRFPEVIPVPGFLADANATAAAWMPSSLHPCPGCGIDEVLALGCYGARLLMAGHALQVGDRLVLQGFQDRTNGEQAAMSCEVVRCPPDEIWVAFDAELPPALTSGPLLRVVRMLPVCPLD
ncbi:hypothetical protein dsx2_3408 [Desulfovibrio sp. X2]|uniref:hypothetical protein n=1 Tax=Desulfovibrio sp. X2 TaxID=941449 RepID=UPI0003587786|nr:hypothetical protein [Desulfovibrio sp. X2]EPR39355.1 hypothetical protein dsx2_3408 [Desulfovibrio sp. X2]